MSQKDDVIAAQESEDQANSRDLVLNLLTVKIVRDPMTHIPVEILEHELPIVNLINGGEENVVVVKSRSVEVANISAGQEFDRLLRKYERSEPRDAVRQIYGVNPRDLADEMGLPYASGRGARAARQQPQSLQVEDGQEVDQQAPVTTISRITTDAPTTTTETAKSPATRQVAQELSDSLAVVAGKTKAVKAPVKAPAKTAAKAKAAPKAKAKK